MKKKLIINCLVLNGSRSGYRRIIKNLLQYSMVEGNDLNGEFDLLFVFQESGFNSLELRINLENLGSSLTIKILEDFNSKWTRGFAEQLVIPYMAMKYGCTHILMPATFGLLFPVKKTITFVHTNTSFSLDKSLRGRGVVQQYIHNVLIKITGYTSQKLLFTTEQTRSEFQKYLGRKYPELILGNGIMASNVAPDKKFISQIRNIGDYILSVSQFYRLKNYDRLINAFIKAKRDGEISDTKLIIVGTIQERDFYSELQDLAVDRDDIYFLHDIKDEEVDYLYANCIAYCFYSIFEGYSLTPAEAILHNKHVSISNIATHQEVYGENAIYADPYSIESIESALIEVIRTSKSNAPSYSREFLQKFSFEGFIRRLISWI